MSIETLPWNLADFLRTEAEIAPYIGLILEEDRDSPAMLAGTVEAIAQGRGGYDVVARETGIPENELRQAVVLKTSEALVPVLCQLKRGYESLASSRMVA